MPKAIFGQLLKGIGRVRATPESVLLDSASRVVRVSEVHVLNQS